MKKLGLLIVVLSLLGMSEVTFAKNVESIENMTGRDGETCSIMLSDTGETAVKEEIAAGKSAAELEIEKERAVPVEK